MHIGQYTTVPAARATMNGKPVLFRENARTVLTDPSEAFGKKLLCDSLVFNLGDACAYSCTYCYCEGAALKFAKAVIDDYNRNAGLANPLHQPHDYQHVVIRRKAALELLVGQLVRPDGTRRYPDPDDHRVIFGSTLVDVAANLELLRETAEACKLILEFTGWQIRLLSKSNLLPRLVEFLPEKYHQRIIFGFSTGTFDEQVGRTIEPNTARIGQRIKALHWLQDRGFRTFGMVCPSLPQQDYTEFSRIACETIRADKCEHVWAEVINVRGDSFTATCNALRREGLVLEEEMLRSVHGAQAKAVWEDYARATFLAHATNIPSNKLHFLQYITPATADWWAQMREHGAVLLGGEAVRRGLTVENGSVLGKPAETP